MVTLSGQYCVQIYSTSGFGDNTITWPFSFCLHRLICMLELASICYIGVRAGPAGPVLAGPLFR